MFVPKTPPAQNIPGLATDHQLPDGTVVWTSPDGQSYTTHPGSRLLFPRLCRPTAAVITRDDLRDGAAPRTGRGLMMPRRKQTRAQQRAKAIADQRRLNERPAAERIAERNKPPPFDPSRCRRILTAREATAKRCQSPGTPLSS